MRVMGGPRDVSMPCPLNEAGGRRVLGERASLLAAAGCSEKYEADVADDVAVGVEGLVTVACRDRGDADTVELADGRRRSGACGASGAVLVREGFGFAGSFAGSFLSRDLRLWCCEPPSELRNFIMQVCWHRQGSALSVHVRKPAVRVMVALRSARCRPGVRML
jgi:hypothetical protein